MDTVASTVIKASVVLVVLSMVKRSWKKRSLPPGPIGLPLLGNAHQLPKGKLWVGLSEWVKVYGQSHCLGAMRDANWRQRGHLPPGYSRDALHRC